MAKGHRAERPAARMGLRCDDCAAASDRSISSSRRGSRAKGVGEGERSRPGGRCRVDVCYSKATACCGQLLPDTRRRLCLTNGRRRSRKNDADLRKSDVAYGWRGAGRAAGRLSNKPAERTSSSCQISPQIWQRKYWPRDVLTVAWIGRRLHLGHDRPITAWGAMTSLRPLDGPSQNSR
jgi:hypothetical protein